MSFWGQWLWYLLAFLVGSAVAWVITVMSISRTTRGRSGRRLSSRLA